MNERLENEKISTLLISLAIPSILAQLTTLIYNLVDRIYIGRLPNSSLAIAGIGLCTSIITIITAVTNLFGRGGAPLASIRLGEKNTEEAQKILGNCFKSLMITSIIIIVILNLFGTQILMLFGASENTLDYALQYLRIYSWGTIFAQLSVGLNYFINAQGFAKYGMFTLLLGGILNIILDPVFIFLFDMGVAGAAVATVISQFVSCLWVFGFFFGKKTMLRLTKKSLKYDLNVMKRVFGLGLSPFFMSSTEGILQVSFNRQLLFYGGDIAVSAMTIMMSMSQILSLPMEGIAQATQPIISYNYGAGKYDRVKKTISLALKAALTYSIVGVLLMELFPSLFVQLFANDPELVELASWMLRVYVFGFIIMGANSTFQQTYTSLGFGKRSFFFAFYRKIILLIPLIYFLPNVISNGVLAVMLAEPISDLLTTITNSFSFKSFIKKHLQTTD
ncbi:MATE family efflux transporter [Erysipelatoclostridium sp. An15]|uniref:MATE family efflux transporter n=1 Tax=Erysipelatoclostridium sp. An15 TaxID=1965566 RepID=UPI000B396B1B|nr:MATE family efflux transporter [Erysipelatoclostridium sp. An15]OUQ09008.1 MATE family efflux transporter [Erysipelatoclostridium sp. An15]